MEEALRKLVEIFILVSVRHTVTVRSLVNNVNQNKQGDDNKLEVLSNNKSIDGTGEFGRNPSPSKEDYSKPFTKGEWNVP